MTRDEVYEALQDRKTVSCGIWSWDANSRHCWSEDDCCYEDFATIDMVMEDIPVYAKWNELEVLN